MIDRVAMMIEPVERIGIVIPFFDLSEIKIGLSENSDGRIVDRRVDEREGEKSDKNEEEPFRQLIHHQAL